MNQQRKNRRQLGGEQEAQAAVFLMKKGYRILERNFTCRFGEIDLIARNQNTLIFVEVKYRTTGHSGNPLEAVIYQKQRRICKTADYYRVLHHLPGDFPCRFDVVAILDDEIRHLEDAFPYCGSGW